jgi:hypothetical protein
LSDFEKLIATLPSLTTFLTLLLCDRSSTLHITLIRQMQKFLYALDGGQEGCFG